MRQKILKKKILSVVIILLAFLCIGCYRDNSSSNEINKSEAIAIAETKPKENVELVLPEMGIPVLMYHMVGNIEDNAAVINEDLFAEQMQYLHDNNYNTLSLEQLYQYLVEKKPVPINPVVLTFDDGYLDTYTIVYPLMKKYNMQATVFINPGDLGGRLDWDMIKEMHENGITISNHGYLHKPMDDSMTKAEQLENLIKGQQELKDKLGIENEYFCYPYGIFDDSVIRMLKEQGIKLAFDMGGGWTSYGDNPLAIKRVWIGNAVTLPYFQERVTSENFTHF